MSKKLCINCRHWKQLKDWHGISTSAMGVCEAAVSAEPGNNSKIITADKAIITGEDFGCVIFSKRKSFFFNNI